MATIKDISKKANVSISTVSRILNGDNSLQVNPQTRARVLKIADELQYHKLTTPKLDAILGTVAIIHWYTKEVSISDLYFRSIRWGAETTLKNAGYAIKRFMFNEELPDSKSIDGIIAIGYFDTKSLNQLKALNKPLVIINQNTLKYGISSISADYTQPVHDIIDYFINQNHKAIGLIDGSTYLEESTNQVDPRTDAFITQMTHRNLLNSQFIFKGDFSIESGYLAMKKAISTLGEQLPTAFFVISDSMAIGALRALHEAKIKVPNDVALFGFGDLEVGHYTYPTLSTVQLPTRQMGTSGALTLLNILSGLQTEPTHLLTSTRLVIRESSAQIEENNF